MRIIHLCLANYYIDNYGYQENILPRVQYLMGHDVKILASTETREKAGKLTYVEPSNYLNEDNIPVCRIPYTCSWLPFFIRKKIRFYKGVYSEISKFKPDVIFMHDGQTGAIFDIIRYLKEYPRTRFYIDSHTDYINSAHGFLSRKILHGCIYKFYISKSIPYVRKYYGTLPSRVKFYTEFYNTPKENTEYLPMGIDDISVDFTKKDVVRSELRSQIGIDSDDFVIVTGGKIERRKNIIELIHAFKSISGEKLILLIFGSVTDDLKQEFSELIASDIRIKHVNWVNHPEMYKYFFASDLACFPGTHSTLWEEAVGYGVPCVFRKWEGIDQFDVDGNCLFTDGTVDNIKKQLEEIINNDSLFQSLKKCAITRGKDKFSYSKISEYCINQ